MATGIILPDASAVGFKKKPKTKRKCNKKYTDCRDNIGTNAGGEPVYRADSMSNEGLGNVSI